MESGALGVAFMLSSTSSSVADALKTSASARRSLPPSLWIALTFLVIAVYLGTTGALPLVGRDEPRYVQIGRAMLEGGDWITPRLGGFHWFEKPILLYWMVAASFGVFGVSEWVARLGPALCGLGSAALLWWMVRPISESAACWSALAAASSLGLLVFSHGATFDIVLSFCGSLALAAWWKSHIEPDGKRATRLLALFWVGVGLSFLAKGLIAFILPALTLAIYAGLRALAGQKEGKLKIGLWWGLPLSLLVGAIWYGPVIWANGWEFVNIFFVQHHFARFTSDKFKHHQPLWFYGEVLPIMLLPWTPFLLGAIWKTRAHLQAATPRARLLVYAWAWLLAPVAFFSLSGSKLPGYILPALPGACVVVGLFVQQWAQNARRQRLVAGLATLFLVAGAALAISPTGIKLAEGDSTRALFAAARARGLADVRVANFRTVARTAQFYAACTLIYGEDGEPLDLQTPAQLADLAREQPLLVLVAPSQRTELDAPALRVEEVARTPKIQLILVRRAVD